MSSATNNFLQPIEDIARNSSQLASLIMAYQLAIEQDMNSSTDLGFAIVSDKMYELSKNCDNLFKDYQEYLLRLKENE